MKLLGAALLVAMTGALVCGPARADWVPPLKGNDTGGIIAYTLAHQADIRGREGVRLAQGLTAPVVWWCARFRFCSGRSTIRQP